MKYEQVQGKITVKESGKWNDRTYWLSDQTFQMGMHFTRMSDRSKVGYTCTYNFQILVINTYQVFLHKHQQL